MSPDTALPKYIADRRWWLLPLLLWILTVGWSYRSHEQEIDVHSLEVASGGARNMFRMVVLTRAWNAQHGGVYVPVSDKLLPNPYLHHPRRDVTTTDGQQLTLVNPAYMTRMMSELAEVQGGTAFHITSLKPLRPGNAPDDWERKALQAFEQGRNEILEVIQGQQPGDSHLRYMAPLIVQQSCLQCHAQQGYLVGDIRGGISVTQPFEPVLKAARAAKRQALHHHLLTLAVVSLFGALLLELLRHRWLALAASNAALQDARRSAETAVVAKNAFLANMSHELRTPLNAIVGYSHLLQLKIADPAQRKQLAGIDKASHRLVEMFSLMFDLVKAENGDLLIEARDFELGALGQSLFVRLEEAAGAKGLGCRLQFEPTTLPCWLHGDPLRIAQLLNEFIDNAVKFSNDGEIVLNITRQAATEGKVNLRFEVIDHGPGIPSAQQTQLFGLFQQLDGSSTRRHGGNGAGLYFARQLAQCLDGEVGCRSKPEQGSCFWFEVRVSTAEIPASA